MPEPDPLDAHAAILAFNDELHRADGELKTLTQGLQRLGGAPGANDKAHLALARTIDALDRAQARLTRALKSHDALLETHLGPKPMVYSIAEARL